MGQFSWAGKGRPNLIVVIVIAEGHVWYRFETNLSVEVEQVEKIFKSNFYSDGDDLGPMLYYERWLLGSKIDPVIFFSVCWPPSSAPCVPGPAALPATQTAEWLLIRMCIKIYGARP